MIAPASVQVRRVRADEWRAVRDLRYEAVRDPDAAIAFLETPESVASRDDSFWKARTETVASSTQAAQFVATDGPEWVGSLSVLARSAGVVDNLGRHVARPRADVVGVYVRPAWRSTGVVDAMLAAAMDWAADRQLNLLCLDVHADNARAQAAYRRFGFTATGVTTDGPTGPELEFAIDLEQPDEPPV